MRILICGGRDYNNFTTLCDKMCDILYKKGWHHPKDAMSPHSNVVIISGMARGADTLAVKYAKINNLTLEKFPADWDKNGKAAGPIRNQQMIDEGKPNLVVAFPGGSGTEDMVRRAKKHNIEVIEID